MDRLIPSFYSSMTSPTKIDSYEIGSLLQCTTTDNETIQGILFAYNEDKTQFILESEIEHDEHIPAKARAIYTLPGRKEHCFRILSTDFIQSIDVVTTYENLPINEKLRFTKDFVYLNHVPQKHVMDESLHSHISIISDNQRNVGKNVTEVEQKIFNYLHNMFVLIS